MRICINADAMLVLIGVKPVADDRVLMEQIHSVIPDFHSVLGGCVKRLLILVIGHKDALLDRKRNKALPAHEEGDKGKQDPSLLHQAKKQQADQYPGIGFAGERKQEAITAESKQAPERQLE